MQNVSEDDVNFKYMMKNVSRWKEFDEVVV